MIDMKLDPSQRDSPMVETAETEGPEYPYGLRLDLNKESLEKLGKSANDFKMDDEMEMTCRVKVCGMSSSSYSDGDSYESVDLQIVSMELNSSKSDDERINRMYGDDDGNY